MKQDLEKARASPIKSVITATPSVTLRESAQKKIGGLRQGGKAKIKTKQRNFKLPRTNPGGQGKVQVSPKGNEKKEVPDKRLEG